MIIIRNKIRELRARDRLTQEELAIKVDVTRQTIASLEKESYVPSLLLGMKIAELFGMSIEEIFYKEEQ